MSYRTSTIFLWITLLLLLFVVPDAAIAQTMPDQSAAFQQAAGIADPLDPRGVAAVLVNVMFSLLATAMMAYLIWGGYLVLTGSGQADRIERGKQVVWTTSVGALMLLAGYAISQFVIVLLDYAANGQQDYRSGGSSIDVNVNENLNRPADPLHDQYEWTSGNVTDFID